MAVVYHWKHGWIPLDHTAALSKAKGDKTAAAKLLSAAPQANGIQSRQHVAQAVMDLPNLHSEADRRDALSQITQGALAHDSTDLLPHDLPNQMAPRSIVKRPADHAGAANPTGSVGNIARDVPPAEVRVGDTVDLPGLSGRKQYRVTKVYSPKSDGSVNVDVVDANGRHLELTLPGHSKVKLARRG